jgi:2-desacetyl-2-hydroxyethyl bacteriochlorophyllide A dehydrogenase
MRALTLQFVAPRELALVETELPDPRSGELLVRTLYSGISSGTELLVYRGEVDPDLQLDDTIGALDGTFAYPFRYGYSCVGVVEHSDGRVEPGTTVFVLHPHQSRLICATGDAVECAGIDPRTATMFPLVETAFQIALDAGGVLDEDVFVMGLGSVGILTALLLQRAGARVVCVDPRSWRRSLAGELGVEAVAPGDTRERVTQESGGDGIPLIVEVSGNPTALASALPLLAAEGTVLVGSWYGTTAVSLPLGADFHRRRLTIRSSQVSTIPSNLSARWPIERRRSRVAQLLRELPLERLATHEFPFRRADDAFAALDRGDVGLMHAALVYDEP